MRIALVSDYESSGGANIACGWLARGLIEKNHEVVRIVCNADGQEHPWSTKTWLPPFYIRGLRRVGLKRAYLESARLYFIKQIAKYLHDFKPDVVNIHSLPDALENGWDLELINFFCERWPVFWTLHDMWSFTGRCVYSENCRMFIDGCDQSCPTPNERPSLEPNLIRESWKLRGTILLKHPNLTAIAPSRWIAEEARKGLWRTNPVYHIPYGVCLKSHAVIEKDKARNLLNIPNDCPVALVVAHDLSDRRKGMALLCKALKKIKSSNLFLLTMGKGQLLESVGIKCRSFGYVQDLKLKNVIYSAADFLIHPAIIDNLPCVVLESLACGVPVLSFAVGGLPDMVRPGLSGWLLDEVSEDSLARGIARAIEELGVGSSMRESSRKLIEREYSDVMQAQSYSDLFQGALQDKHTIP